MSNGLPILVYARLAAEQLVPEPDSYCISITNPRQSPARLAGWADVLRLGFHDTDRPGGGFTLMTREHGLQVLDFCRAHRDRPLVVHCEAGASRSVGVGLFVAAWLQRPLVLTATDVLSPNPWVVQQMRQAGAIRALAWRDLRLLQTAWQGPKPIRLEHSHGNRNRLP